MNHKGTVALETKRLILRQFTIDDAEAMFRNWASDAEVTKYLTWPTHADISVSKAVIESWIPLYEKLGHYSWAIVLKENNEPIGNNGSYRVLHRSEMVATWLYIGSIVGTCSIFL